MQHLCSRTLKPSHTESFVDAWTSSLEDSHVSHLAKQVRKKVSMIAKEATFFPTSQTESESANLEFAFSKTYKESSAARQPTESQFSNMSSESWKEWVTEQRREYSQRKKSAHLTRENESLSWATPVAMNDGIYADNSPNKNNRHSEGLATQVQNWPTATARDWKGCGNAITRKDGKHRIDNLEAVIKYGHPDQANLNTNGKSQESWPTPRANKVHPQITEENREHLANRNKANLEEDIAGHCGKATGNLNPNWVEHLMGLPVGWTQLPTEWIDSGC